MTAIDRTGPAVGLKHEATLEVTTELAVSSLVGVFPGLGEMPPVFATAFMVAFIEATCVEALRPYLGPGQASVGTHIDVSHVAATPVGGKVVASVELTALDGWRLSFRVRCQDDRQLIGEGRHERFIIDVERFIGRVRARAG